MGILDNFAKRVADQISKAAPEVSAIQQFQQNPNLGYGNSTGLPRNPILANVPFTPGQALVPGAINPVRDDGRADPRRYEYQVAQNINITETRPVPFKTLRAAADQIDILRRCIEVMKAKIAGLEWDISLGSDAVEKIIAETGLSPVRAMAVAKERYTQEINRLRQFWETPDVSNGLVFSDWLSMAVEDILVLDAWAVWPQMTVGGDLNALQILDGGTIKPLIDDRGMRPLPPFPAFQQILYGFPRSEFSAPTESENTDGEFSADELAYFVRNRRTTSVYGYGPVERALPLADIYLRRQQWLRAEYTDGVLPELMLKSDGSIPPDLLKAYENVLNDDLSGQTEQRKRARLLPGGLEPVTFDGYGEKFRDVLDEFLVTSICGHFGVLPTEIGFTPKSGLGGAGHATGQAESSEVIGLIPLSNWVASMLTQLSYVFLGMPRELEFKFQPSKRQDEEAAAKAGDIRLKNGSFILNEERAKLGLPLIDAPDADLPIIATTQGLFIMRDEGLTAVSASGETAPATPPNAGQVDAGITEKPADETPSNPVEPAEPTADADLSDETPIDEKSAVSEMKTFIRWLRKSPTRPFEFENVPTVYGETLNKFVEVGDHDGARWYAERYLG